MAVACNQIGTGNAKTNDRSVRETSHFTGRGQEPGLANAIAFGFVLLLASKAFFHQGT